MAKKHKDKYIEAAQKLMQKQQFDKAIKEYEKAFKEDSKDARVALKLGQLYEKIKKPQEGIKFFKQAASIYAKGGFYNKAIPVYKQILGIDGSQFDVKVEIADLYSKLGLMSDAITQYKSALDKYEKDGNAEKVLDIVKKMVEIEPQNATNRIKLAEFYFKGGHRDQGYTEFQRAAQEFKNAQRWDDLVKLYDKLTKADPANADNFVGLGDALIERGELEKAFQAFLQVLKFRPDDMEAMEKIVQVSLRLKDSQNAAYYLQVLADKSAAKGDKEGEKKYLQRKYKVQPDPETKVKLGDSVPDGPAAAPPPKAAPAAYQKEQVLEAEDIGEAEVMALEPAGPADAPLEEADTVEEPEAIEEDLPPPTEDQIPGMFTEIGVYLQYDLIDKAQQLVSRILKAFPKNYEALRFAGIVYKKKGNNQKAIKGLLTAAKAAKAAGALDEARQYSEEVLEIDPSNSHARSFIAEIDAGEEISLGVDEAPEELEPVEAEEEVLTLDGQPTGAAKKAPAEDHKLELAEPEVEPFSFAEDKAAGDDKLMLVDDDVPQLADEPVLELEGEEPAPKPAPKAAPKPAPKPKSPAQKAQPDTGPMLEVEDEGPMLEVEEEEEEITLGAPQPPPKAAPKPAPPPPKAAPKPAPPPPKAAPKPAAPPPKPAPAMDFDAEMEEVDFYQNQGLVKEARKILDKILKAAPNYAPAIQKLKAIEEAAAVPEAPIFEEIEEVELEEDSAPTISNVADSAEEAVSETFREEEEEEMELSADSLEEVGLEEAEEELSIEQDTEEVQLQEEAAEEVSMEVQEEELPAEPEPMEAAEETPMLAVEEEEEGVEEALPEPEPELEPEIEEEPVAAADSDLDLEDEWGEEAPAGEPVEEETPVAGIDALADAADDAWGDALEPEDEAPAQPTAAEVHPEIEGMADAAEEAFGAAFGSEAAKEEEFDLSSVLHEEEQPAEAEEVASDVDDISAVLSAFRDRVHDQIGQDANAYFDLGIAYKEMGLYDDAINSFRSALKAGANPSECLNMIGLCFTDRGEFSKAESVFREGLKESNLEEEDVKILKYELGLVLEEQERFSESLEVFKEVEKIDPKFREVANVLIRLEERLGGPPPTSREKISYI